MNHATPSHPGRKATLMSSLYTTPAGARGAVSNLDTLHFVCVRDKLPLCDVYVLGPRGRELVTCLVDSGASYCVFPERVAEDAGLSLSKAPRTFRIQYEGSDDFGRLVRTLVKGATP